MKKSLPLIVVWIGQIISLFGSGLTGFALGVWLYQRTGSASNFALVALCSALPQLLVSPLAGVLVDRYPRRRLMALADSGSALCTLIIAALFVSGAIQVWHIYLITALSSACGALQAPAYSALVATLIPRQQLARANGMIQLGQGLAEILAPASAGLLVLAIGVPGVLVIDLSTYLVAVAALLLVRLPEAQGAPSALSSEPAGPRAGLWKEARAGWHFLRSERSLMALLSFQALFSFLWNLFGVLVTPMVLGFAAADGLGVFLTVAGSGMLAGSLVMSVWGGPRKRLTGLLVFEFISALAFVLMGLRPNLLLAAAAAFLAHWTLAFVSSLNEAIWQSQTPAEVRGRVFALKQAVIKGAVLLAYLLAGALADRVLNPLLLPGGPLAGSLGPLFGVGAGRGIALLFVLIGVIKAGAALWLAKSPAACAIGPLAEVRGASANGL
jgi:predicted MFS family arabinose efflux permease